MHVGTMQAYAQQQTRNPTLCHTQDATVTTENDKKSHHHVLCDHQPKQVRSDVIFRPVQLMEPNTANRLREVTHLRCKYCSVQSRHPPSASASVRWYVVKRKGKRPPGPTDPWWDWLNSSKNSLKEELSASLFDSIPLVFCVNILCGLHGEKQ